MSRINGLIGSKKAKCGLNPYLIRKMCGLSLLLQLEAVIFTAIIAE